MSTILLVEDDVGLLGALKAVVAQAGFDVKVSSNGADALTAVRARAPDAIVSDNMMPVMSGVELWRSLAQHPLYARIPFLLQSAVADFPTDVHPTGFLRKPYSPAALLALLELWMSP